MDELEQMVWNMTNHTPNDDVIGVIEALRHQFKKVGTVVLTDCPGSRERSIAMTKLEEALMWAVASVARAR